MGIQLLDDSYARHPHFDFAEPSMSCPEAALASFNAAYAKLLAGAQNMSGAEHEATVDEALTALQAAFAELAQQAADDRERRFLAELQGECARLAREEFDFYRSRSRRPRGSRLATNLTTDQHFFGMLPSQAVDEIRSVAKDDLVSLRANAKSGKLTRENLTVSSGPTVKRITKVLNRAFRSLGVLAAVSEYAGRPMRVRGAAFELSVPQSVWWRNAFAELPRPPHTLYAHLDESIAVPKAIVYLSDVGPTHGPTSCYPGVHRKLDLNPMQAIVGRVIANVGASPASPLYGYYDRAYHQAMSSPQFRRHFMRLPAELRFNSHFGWDVQPESQLETEMVDAETPMLGKAGTFIVFDGGNLVHRGGLIEAEERIALQVIFGEANLWRRIRKKLAIG